MWDSSNVVYEQGRIIRYDKVKRTPDMHYIDYGINAFSSKAFAPFASEDSFDLADLQMSLVAQEELAGFEVKERFYEVGSHAGLSETDAFICAQLPPP
jgi:NDP-sugar pyrophosphorylase family protein